MKRLIFPLGLIFCVAIAGSCFGQTVEAGATVQITVEASRPTIEATPVKIERVIPTLEAKPTVEVKPVIETKPVVLAPPVRFSDVPSDHWAAKSVYELVNLGVTQGYPDGTFRGSNNITRYETAMFLSKLAGAIGGRGEEIDISVEKLKDELRTEIRSLRAEIAELRRIPEETEEKAISGSYSARIIFGNLLTTRTSDESIPAPVGPMVRYRLKTAFAKTLGEGAKLKINIDTMDSGFGGGSSELSTKILDIEGNMKLNLGMENPVEVKVTSGPGPVVHTEEANADGNYIARSENGVVYLRPWNSMMFSTKWIGIDLGLGYIARKQNTFGEVEVNQVNGSFGLNFPGIFVFPSFRFNTNVDYLSSRPQSDPVGPTDTKVTIDMSSAISQKHKLSAVYSVGQGESPHNTMFGFGVDMLDVWDTGTIILLKYKKVGTEYLYENQDLNEDLFAGLDVFNRYIGNGSGSGVVDIGLELTQVLTETLRLVGKADYRLSSENAYDDQHPECSQTIDAGVSWDIATDTLFEAFYRVENIPAAADPSSDMTQVSLHFKF